jgi:hypothetical protein
MEMNKVIVAKGTWSKDYWLDFLAKDILLEGVPGLAKH